MPLTYPISGKQSFNHPMTRSSSGSGSKKDPTKSKVQGVAGRVPVLDLLRIWDTGASQGMVDKAVISSKNSFVGGARSLCIPETVQ